MKRKIATNKVNGRRAKNPTTNYSIPPKIQERELEEYRNGTLPQEHDLYLGERMVSKK